MPQCEKVIYDHLSGKDLRCQLEETHDGHHAVLENVTWTEELVLIARHPYEWKEG